MRRILSLLTGFGDFLLSLSDRTRKVLVLGALLLLGGGGVYKLVVNLKRLTNPLPMASPEQILRPMEKLVRQTSSEVTDYQSAKQANLSRLDSISRKLTNFKPANP
ncbi:hypothetical protein GO755_27940 [Spirosoma sp. HMF4905]|uniref:Uncharacterized protein n=1 Tax=Spirosoma arboris TaxID=2682092 RepID=A0A7K1SJB8_9BACT|nr:hypothetical protein [Spirosoma arboris]MVM33900.1 hypothetical protein [Spirosoma arboris]